MYESYLFPVNLHMLFQVGPRAESFVTGIAHKGLLPRVDPLVSDQI